MSCVHCDSCLTWRPATVRRVRVRRSMGLAIGAQARLRLHLWQDDQLYPS